MSRENVKVGVGMEDRNGSANGDSTDEAVNELANRLSFSATGTVKHGGHVIVDWPGWNDRCAGEEAAESLEMLFVASAREHFHPNGVADRYLVGEQLVDPVTDRRPGVPKKQADVSTRITKLNQL